MDWGKEAYNYENYFGSLKGAKIKPVYCPFIFTGYLQAPQPYSPIAERTYSFLNSKSAQSPDDSMDFFKQKLDLATDKTDLILDQIKGRDGLKYENLKRLYADLLRLDNWRLEHDPSGYLVHDKLWQDQNKMELDLRSQIRRELNDSSRDTAFPEKDLRDSLLEVKIQKSKSDMLGGGLEIELDSSQYEKIGDPDPPREYE